MTGTAWGLAVLLVGAAGLCIWAYLTGWDGPDWRQETARQPGEHTRRRRDQETQRLTPEAPDWIPPWERPGGQAQRLPSHEEVLRARERSHEL